MVNEVLKTELPEDWDAVTLGDYAQIFRGGSPRPIQDFITTSDKGINWIKIGDVGIGAKYITTTEEKIIPEGVSRSRMVYEGDLILSNSMSFGRPYIMNIEGCIHDGWLVIQKYDKAFCKDYLYYALSSELTMQQYISMAAGSSVQNLNKEKVSKVVLPCPPIAEQKLIAEILADIDAMITDVEKLIDKQRNIKVGCLQHMLVPEGQQVPQIRLPGYSGEWRPRKLGDGTSIKARIGWQKLTREEYLEAGNYYLITGTDITESHRIDYSKCYYVSRERYLKDENIQVHDGDIIVTKDGTIGKVARIEKLDKPATLNSHLFVVRDLSGSLNNRFLLHILSSNIFKRFVEETKTGTTLTGLPQKTFVQFEFMVPSMKEQEEIADVLDDLDLNISILQTKLNKYLMLKQGMMEELLTGKVRLV